MHEWFYIRIGKIGKLENTADTYDAINFSPSITAAAAAVAA